MTGSHGMLHVSLAADGFFPQAFRWNNRLYRVLAVHSVRTNGYERRYRVVTSGGYFELALHLALGTWRLGRRPNRLSQLWYRWLNGARYPLPAWRRRSVVPVKG